MTQIKHKKCNQKINKLIAHLEEDIKEQKTGIKRDKQSIKMLRGMKP